MNLFLEGLVAGAVPVVLLGVMLVMTWFLTGWLQDRGRETDAYSAWCVLPTLSVAVGIWLVVELGLTELSLANFVGITIGLVGAAVVTTGAIVLLACWLYPDPLEYTPPSPKRRFETWQVLMMVAGGLLMLTLGALIRGNITLFLILWGVLGVNMIFTSFFALRSIRQDSSLSLTMEPSR